MFTVTVVANGLQPPVAVETAAYRIAVEAMSNSARYRPGGRGPAPRDGPAEFRPATEIKPVLDPLLAQMAG